MTLDEILNLDIKDINRLAKEDPRELRKITSRINAVAAKRVKRLEKVGIKTPSLSAFTKGGGVKSIRGQDTDFVKAQFGKVKRFLESGTSTVTQARAFERDVKERLGIEDLTADQTRKFWDVLGKIQDKYGSVRQWVPSNELIAYLRDLASGAEVTPEQMLERAEEWITNEYESAEYQELGAIGGGVSEFFDE